MINRLVKVQARNETGRMILAADLRWLNITSGKNVHNPLVEVSSDSLLMCSEPSEFHLIANRPSINDELLKQSSERKFISPVKNLSTLTAISTRTKFWTEFKINKQPWQRSFSTTMSILRTEIASTKIFLSNMYLIKVLDDGHLEKEISQLDACTTSHLWQVNDITYDFSLLQFAAQHPLRIFELFMGPYIQPFKHP